MQPHTHLLALLTLLALLPAFCSLALITALLSTLILSLRVVSVCSRVCIAVLAEQWVPSSSSSSSSAGRVVDRVRVRGQSGRGLGRSLWEGEEEILLLPVGRVDYATLVRPREPVSGGVASM
ncbi:hypothetical protein HOY82DRAFT_68252 [Tuber indicum]|nr:hypothetical protein HOY82DRAFT_68252 [Tuber indicum]